MSLPLTGHSLLLSDSLRDSSRQLGRPKHRHLVRVWKRRLCRCCRTEAPLGPCFSSAANLHIAPRLTYHVGGMGSVVTQGYKQAARYSFPEIRFRQSLEPPLLSPFPVWESAFLTTSLTSLPRAKCCHPADGDHGAWITYSLLLALDPRSPWSCDSLPILNSTVPPLPTDAALPLSLLWAIRGQD